MVRRKRLWLGLIYVGGAVYGVAEVVTGRAPVQSLIGLPIAAVLAWLYLAAASRVKVPPA